MLALCATVLKVRPGRAFVVVESSENCASCVAHGACAAPRFQHLKPPLEVVDPLGVHVGDRVEIQFPAGSLWKLAVLFFGFPAGALMLGTACASSLGWSSNVASVMSGAGAFLLALALSIVIYRKMNRSGEALPAIVRMMTVGAAAFQGEEADPSKDAEPGTPA
ncbi:SoxR reducing system RseC family protein [Desulfosoma sp.]|uniref:SoxR reducing system RseC family protein n=1 Tax=Desulfosoma sp. TaxID=2603217 RepID=UPI00404A85BA